MDHRTQRVLDRDRLQQRGQLVRVGGVTGGELDLATMPSQFSAQLPGPISGRTAAADQQQMLAVVVGREMTRQRHA
ncbi:hypothetical protein DSM44344_03851 [Mycobacterium marinum]|nr:hypothetical protein DSM44344_03851 [Mycobacterium marinum]